MELDKLNIFFDQLDVYMLLLIGVISTLLYFFGVLGFLNRSLQHSFLLGYYAFDLKGNLALLAYQFQAVPNILYNLFVTRTGYLNFSIRLSYALLFLVPRLLSHHPLIYIIINVLMFVYIIIFDSFPKILIALYIIEMITGQLAVKYIDMFSERQLILFLGGPDILFFFEETTILSFFKN